MENLNSFFPHQDSHFPTSILKVHVISFLKTCAHALVQKNMSIGLARYVVITFSHSKILCVLSFEQIHQLYQNIQETVFFIIVDVLNC